MDGYADDEKKSVKTVGVFISISLFREFSFGNAKRKKTSAF